MPQERPWNSSLAPLGHAYLQHRLTVERDEHAAEQDYRKLRILELKSRVRKTKKKTTKPKAVKPEADVS